MNASTRTNSENTDEAKRFARFMTMCATGGLDPFQAGGVDGEMLLKLQKQPHLHHNGEVLFLAEGGTGNPQWMFDRRLERFAKERTECIAWAYLPCFGQIHCHRSDSGTFTRSKPGPVTGPDGVVPKGLTIGKQTFKLRVIGISPEELKQLAIELGRRLGETEVYIRRFNAEEWETVAID